MQPIVFHLDMNSYFASVEQQEHPEYRGRPLGVCEHLGGIIIAASIEAKKWGIKTGTPVWEAQRLYPKIILSHTHPDRYRLYIKRVMKVVGDYTGAVEQYSIDELFADMSKACNIRALRAKGVGLSKIDLALSAKPLALVSDYYQVDPFEEAINIAKEIKRRMKKEVADYLTCSIGIAENKLLAKIGSDMQKPDGLVVVLPSCHSGIPYRGTGQVFDRNENIIGGQKYPESSTKPRTGSRTFFTANDIHQREKFRDDTLILTKDELYHRLKLTDIPGIGHRQEKNLNKLGIKTLLDLKNYPLSWLISRFGINGYHLHKMGRLEGSWRPVVEQDEEIKSIGHMYTLPMEFREKKFFAPVLYKLCEMVARRMRKQELMGNIIHFYIRDKNYEGFGESKKLGFYVYDGREIFLQAMRICEDAVGAGFSRPLANIGRASPAPTGCRLIGITVAGLRPYARQLSLFGDEEKKKRLVDSLDKINGKYGDFTICRVPILAAKEAFKDSIGFGRIKENKKDNNLCLK